MSNLHLSYQAPVARITLSRPEKHNAMTQAMWQALDEGCEKIRHDLSPKAVVIDADGGKAFCAGADIDELKHLLSDQKALDNNNAIVQRAQQNLHSLACATLARIQGVCVGGGLGIALACDFRICTPDAVFAITPAKLGLLYSIEDTRRLVNVVGFSRAREMLILGKKIDSSTALQWGLVNQVVEANKLAETVQDWVEQITNVSANSVSGIKQTLAYLGGNSAISEESVRRLFEQAFQHQDFQEGAESFLQKRPPTF